MISRSGARETATIDSAIRSRHHDLPFLIAAVGSPFVSVELLDSLADSDNYTVATVAVQNARTSTATLERVYRTSRYRAYFGPPIVAHPHASPSVLREIYQKEGANRSLTIWFAKNASTPVDVLDDIARTTREPAVMDALLDNPEVDCKSVSDAATGGRWAIGYRNEDIALRIRTAGQRLCAPPPPQ